MGYKVIFAPQAIERLEEIVRYIAQDNPAAAEKLGLRLVDQTGLLTIIRDYRASKAGSPKEKWSERRDLNPRPSGPKPDALPNYATLR